MKKILGLIGSPRKAGNSELVVKEICRNLGETCDLRMIRLPSMDIKPCQACYTCITKDRCPIEDDFSAIMDEVVKADAVIIAAPVYLLGANASVKLFLDRGLQFHNYHDRIWGKPGLAVTVAGVEGQEGYAHVTLATLAKMMGIELKENVVLYGALPGEVLFDNANRRHIADLGRALFEKQYRPEVRNNRCPICQGDTFQFISGRKVKCATCRHIGCVSTQGESLELEIPAGQHTFYWTYEEAKEHKVWLKQMKEKFLIKKTRIRTIREEYKNDGSWVMKQK